MSNTIRNAAAIACFTLFGTLQAHAWWDKEWTVRKPFTIDTTDAGVKMTDPAGTALVLLRLHAGNFDFASSPDGSDLRLVAEDDKTILDSHVEKFDSLMNEAFVWVKVPDIKPGAQIKFWLYSGNGSGKVEASSDYQNTYDEDTLLVYHFPAQGAATDSTKNKNNAEAGGPVSEGALIGSGVRVLGNTTIRIPTSETFKHAADEPLTLSSWVKMSAGPERAVLFDWADGAAGFQLGVEKGIPYVQIKDDAGTHRTTDGAPIAEGAWKHFAVVASNATTTLYIDGDEYAKVDAAIPALTTGATLGADSEGKQGAVGELDEFELSKIARGPGWVKFSAVSQSGSDASTKLLTSGEAEGGAHGGGGEAMEHLSLFGDIAKNMMFDGWVVIFFCAIMAVVCWVVAFQKLFYLNKIKKGDDEFLNQWKQVAADLTVLDHQDPENVKSLGGTASPKLIKLLKLSPLYHIYHIGSEEIRNRLTKAGFNGLSGRSIEAIKASLHAGLTREIHRMNNGLIFLTIGIAGGPYVGLLGTVMGVMITFAVISKSGEVEVASIAPGIASALLATVAGLVVAIPALFIYSYLSTRIKNVISNMQLFIDEFIAKMAEFYPPAENNVPVRRIELPKEMNR